MVFFPLGKRHSVLYISTLEFSYKDLSNSMSFERLELSFVLFQKKETVMCRSVPYGQDSNL